MHRKKSNHFKLYVSGKNWLQILKITMHSLIKDVLRISFSTFNLYQSHHFVVNLLFKHLHFISSPINGDLRVRLCPVIPLHFLLDVFIEQCSWYLGLPGGSDKKESTCNAVLSRAEKILWRREWPHTPIFLPVEFYGQRDWLTTVSRVTKSQTWLSD